MPKRDRQRERKAKASQQLAADAARRRRFKEYLLQLGAPPRLLASEVAAALQERCNRRPLVTTRDAASNSPSAETIVAELRAALRTTSIEVIPNGHAITLVDFFTDYVTTAQACRAGLKGVTLALEPDWNGFAASVVKHKDENMHRGLRATVEALDAVLLRHCQIDGWLYSIAYLNTSEPSGKARMTITLECHRSESKLLVLDGQPRPAWRCGLPFGITGLSWVSWTAAVRGADEEAGVLDVFLQAHVIQRLYERVPIERWSVQDWMWQSLRSPVLTPQGKGRWLVEFRIAQWRLGYFGAVEADGKVVVTTFLFLTMSGTPEGDKLRRRLRMSTKDVEWLQIDTLAYYALSDVRLDPDLRTIFADCGCGHLFNLLKPDAKVELRDGFAQRTRMYLSLPLPGM